MKKLISLRPVSRGVSCAAALLLSTVTVLCVLRAAEKPATTNPTSTLARELLGQWVQVGEPGKIEQPPAKGGFIKLRTARHWAAIDIDPRTSLSEASHGGTWRVNGNVYQETTDFGAERHAALMNQTFTWKVKIEGDLMTMTPLDGNPWSEVWKRVK